MTSLVIPFLGTIDGTPIDLAEALLVALNQLKSDLDVLTAAPIVYGTGQDLSPTFDGVTPVVGASLAGSTYTLTRDAFYASPTVAAGVTLKTAGLRCFASGTFTNNGTVHCDGIGAVLGTAGGSSPLGNLGIGTAGGNGHAGVGAGSNGTAQTNVLQDASLAGGNGGAGGAQAGGNGGAYNVSSSVGGANYLAPFLSGFTQTASSGGNQATLSIIGGGAGGGGGGSDNAGVTGGGGGGGGGVLILHAFNLVNNGIIRAAGGAGASASGAGGNGGSGGGGGGGVILSIARYRSGNAMVAPGGLPGAAIVGTGMLGAVGSAGHINLGMM